MMQEQEQEQEQVEIHVQVQVQVLPLCSLLSLLSTFFPSSLAPAIPGLLSHPLNII